VTDLTQRQAIALVERETSNYLPSGIIRAAIKRHLSAGRRYSLAEVKACIEEAGALCGRWLASTVKEEDLPPVSRGRERVAPLVERKAESAFPWGTHWWRCKYEIREAPPEVSEIPVRCVVAVRESKGEWYDVLTTWRTSAPAKQPERPDSAEQDHAPHVALARLNPWDEQDILRFVNRWGLLGLWKAPRYKEGAGLFATHKPGPKDWTGEEEEHSGWYIWDEFYQQSNKGLYMHSFCEPVELFAEAAEEYQELTRRLAAGKESLEEASEAELTLCGWLQECAHPRPIYDAQKKAWLFGWQCNSLLGWVYLLTFLDLVQGRTFRRCARRNCGRLFIPTRPNAMYCSDACRNAEHQACHRERNPKPSGLRKSSESLAGSCP